MSSRNQYIMLMVCLFLSCTSPKNYDEPFQIPYIAKGDHPGLYENFGEIKIEDAITEGILDYAKGIALKSGYKITGATLEEYLYEGKRYPIDFHVYENSNYYLVLFIPQGTHRTSLDLKIYIKKANREVVLLFQGS